MHTREMIYCDLLAQWSLTTQGERIPFFDLRSVLPITSWRDDKVNVMSDP